LTPRKKAQECGGGRESEGEREREKEEEEEKDVYDYVDDVE
jgi:hypothetical protein